MSNEYNIVKYGERWAIVKGENGKIISTFDSQEEALDEALKMSLPAIYKERLKTNLSSVYNLSNIQRPS